MYLPPGVTSATLGSAFPIVSYYNTAIDFWRANTPVLAECMDFKQMPRRSGRMQQFYGVQPFSGSLQKVTEGVPPNSEQQSTVVSDVFADEFGNWIGISNIVDMTFVNNGVTDATKNLSYQAALVGNLVGLTAVDSDATSNSAARIDLGDNEFILSSTVAKTEAQLAGNNVPVRPGGEYTMLMHGFMAYDLFGDNTAGGITDTAKRSESGQEELRDGISKNYTVTHWKGHRIIRTSTVSTFSNYPSNGKTGYGCYSFGFEAFLASNLTGIEVPKDPQFQVMVTPLTTPDLTNPLLQTRCIVGYDFFLGVVARPNTNSTPGYRRIRAEISAI